MGTVSTPCGPQPCHRFRFHPFPRARATQMSIFSILHASGPIAEPQLLFLLRLFGVPDVRSCTRLYRAYPSTVTGPSASPLRGPGVGRRSATNGFSVRRTAPQDTARSTTSPATAGYRTLSSRKKKPPTACPNTCEPILVPRRSVPGPVVQVLHRGLRKPVGRRKSAPLYPHLAFPKAADLEFARRRINAPENLFFTVRNCVT